MSAVHSNGQASSTSLDGFGRKENDSFSFFLVETEGEWGNPGDVIIVPPGCEELLTTLINRTFFYIGLWNNKCIQPLRSLLWCKIALGVGKDG